MDIKRYPVTYYKGWSVRFDGWQRIPQACVYTGWWRARRGEEQDGDQLIYIVTREQQGKFTDLTFALAEDRGAICMSDLDEVFAEEKSKARQELLKIIDDVVDQELKDDAKKQAAAQQIKGKK